MTFHHISVLLHETISSLNIKADGIYVDCTAGGGGHSAAILEKLGDNGRLILIDQDPQAIDALNERFSSDKRVTIVKSNFSNLEAILTGLGINSVDGILADLGVSSHQLDTAERGFSVHNEGKIDMRMSLSGLSAADVVNTFGERELAKIIMTYGEEKYARSIARSIVRERAKEPIITTTRLAEIVKYSIPAAARRTGGNPSRKTFQALRIYVNDELGVLENTLDTMFNFLKIGGRLSIITFHSLEDRIVKRKFIQYSTGCTCKQEFPQSPVCICGKVPHAVLPFKFIKASESEVEENPRSRSATLRTAEKLIDLDK